MAFPHPQGLYHPAQEKDACGVAFVADLYGRRSHDVVAKGLSALIRLDHRGARGAEYNTGDGAGIMIQIPDQLYRGVLDFELPPAGHYATGLVFLPNDPRARARASKIIEKYAVVEGGEILGWRDVPVRPDGLGASAEEARPYIRQVFVSASRLTGDRAGEPLTGLELERAAFCIRKQAERETSQRGIGAYLPSLSSRTITYKGMLTPDQLPAFFPDLTDARTASAIALVHSRFSTNTFPSWPLAHPYRFIAHNGEINTIRGNRNWMQAREALLRSKVLPGKIKRLFPIVTPEASDSAGFDEVLELLHLAGRSVPHAVMMMVPEAWENDTSMCPDRRAFYPDLADERVTSALALVHSRFSTNTFPSWSLAHPYRYVAHNGEINTLRGNRNWMTAREALLASDLIPGDLKRLSPIVTPDASDSATFDEVLELLHLGGRSLPHAVLMMIPEAWENHGEMDPARRAFSRC